MSRTPIGVSKRVCWLCHHYLENLANIEKVEFLVSENQGKIHGGWAMPPDTSNALTTQIRTEKICLANFLFKRPPFMPKKDHHTHAMEAAMRLLVQWEINDIRESIIARRRSDSFPNEEWNDTLRNHCVTDWLDSDSTIKP